MNFSMLKNLYGGKIVYGAVSILVTTVLLSLSGLYQVAEWIGLL